MRKDVAGDPAVHVDADRREELRAGHPDVGVGRDQLRLGRLHVRSSGEQLGGWAGRNNGLGDLIQRAAGKLQRLR